MTQRASTSWLDDRLGISQWTNSLAERQVSRRSVLRYFAGMALVLLAVLVATGVLLMVHYDSDALRAHASVSQIIGILPYGAFIHSVHSWASDLLVLCLWGTFFSAAIERSFKAPHELLWVTGLAAFVAVVAIAFSGGLLPWTQASYLRAQIGSHLLSEVPLLGAWLHRVLLGGSSVTAETLHHAFGLHVAVLPMFTTALVGIHLWLLRRRRVEPTPEVPSLPLYPHIIARQAAAAAFAVFLVSVLAVFIPRGLGPALEATAPQVSAKLPWYIAFAEELATLAPRDVLGASGTKGAVVLLMTLCTLAFLVPFIDRRGSKVTAVVAGVTLALLLVLTGHAVL